MRKHRFLWIAALLRAAVIAWPGYRWWGQQRLQSLEVECRQALLLTRVDLLFKELIDRSMQSRPRDAVKHFHTGKQEVVSRDA